MNEDEDVQCWHTEPDTPCDWNICRQPEKPDGREDIVEKAREINRQMFDDPAIATTGVITASYTDRGKELWAVRCWGEVPGCDGLVSYGHESEAEADRMRALHIGSDHPNQGDPGE